MSFSAQDLKRIQDQLIADVRRETIEECARLLISFAKDARQAGMSSASAYEAAAKILEVKLLRALLDEPKAESEPFLKCGVCGGPPVHWHHSLKNPDRHFFETRAMEPEEPGHG